MSNDVKLEQLTEWRRGEVQAIGAAISTRNWHSLEAAYNALRDKMDRVIHAPPATRHQPQERDAILEEAAKACEEQQRIFASSKYAAGQPMSSFGERFAAGRCAEAIRALKTTPAPAVSRDDQALLADIFDKMAEVVAPLPGIPDAPGQHAGTRAIEPSDGDEA